MSRKSKDGPVCRHSECRETRLQYYTDFNGNACERCPRCNESRQIPRVRANTLPQPYVTRARRGEP